MKVETPNINELVRFTRILVGYGCVNGEEAEPEDACDGKTPDEMCGPCEAAHYLKRIGRDRVETAYQFSPRRQ